MLTRENEGRRANFQDVSFDYCASERFGIRLLGKSPKDRVWRCKRVTDTPEQVASALCAVCVVEDIKEPRVLLQVLLQSRRAWVRANLHQAEH